MLNFINQVGRILLYGNEEGGEKEEEKMVQIVTNLTLTCTCKRANISLSIVLSFHIQ